jgi:hypothetical protein
MLDIFEHWQMAKHHQSKNVRKKEFGIYVFNFVIN